MIRAYEPEVNDIFIMPQKAISKAFLLKRDVRVGDDVARGKFRAKIIKMWKEKQTRKWWQFWKLKVKFVAIKVISI